LQSLRAEGGEVDGGAQGEQTLVGADVARRLLATDVLLARLQRQHPAALAIAIGRLADQSSRHLAQELLVAAAGQQPDVRPAVGSSRTRFRADGSRKPSGVGSVSMCGSRLVRYVARVRRYSGWTLSAMTTLPVRPVIDRAMMTASATALPPS